MTESTTIRERLKNIERMSYGHDSWFDQIHAEAVAALDLLDNAHTWYRGSTKMRAVPDPAPRDTAVQHLEGGPSMFGDETAEEHYTRTCTGDAGNTAPRTMNDIRMAVTHRDDSRCEGCAARDACCTWECPEHGRGND